MIEIPLSSKTYPGLVALIDNADAELVEGYAWHPSKRKKTLYARTRIPGSGQPGNYVLMHQLIAGKDVDHADRNGLNNTRENLRVATSSQQSAHRGISSNNTSGYKGVSWNKQTSNWQARIQLYGKRKSLGLFTNPIDAAKAYDQVALEHHGDFAVLNFPI